MTAALQRAPPSGRALEHSVTLMYPSLEEEKSLKQDPEIAGQQQVGLRLCHRNSGLTLVWLGFCAGVVTALELLPSSQGRLCTWECSVVSKPAACIAVSHRARDGNAETTCLVQ